LVILEVIKDIVDKASKYLGCCILFRKGI